ncbi:type II secretion system F family protein [Streptomyces sp. ISL-22]|uniref:type II secretion system F family protein n=1 Tax=unclassified Streptomyces TaxID=2593676 RepID=UPI001BE7261C|nr:MULTISPECIES: type II secretion system F family protein [unclassified Streptomyces]MBT2422888.1 type II secretion system F family protein [Streptomyces sp. ISL-24]MBT2434031.1 type II secretion system F family protein [Streptomyces sp. ISL-22]
MSGEVVHRLGTAVGAALVVGWLLRWPAAARRERRARRRLAGLMAATDVTSTRRRFDVRQGVRRGLPMVAVVGAGWALVGGVAGLVVGLLVAAGLWLWSRRQGAGGDLDQADAGEVARQLPVAADLLAACIAAGAGPVVAAQAVGEALGGPFGNALARGAAEVRLGGEPGEAWRRLASLPGAGALARLLERADVSGLPAAGPVARLAADARADWARAATERARRAAVMVTAPVGLCFLPAFIAVGVAPVVIGLAGGVLGGSGG